MASLIPNSSNKFMFWIQKRIVAFRGHEAIRMSACRGHCTSPLILSMQCLLARKAWVYCFCYNICSIGSFSLGSHQVPDEFVQLLQLLHLQIYIWSSHWLVTSCWHKLLPPMIAQLWKARWMTFYTYSVTPRLICKTAAWTWVADISFLKWLGSRVVRGWNSFWTDILSPKKRLQDMVLDIVLWPWPPKIRH